MYNHSVVAGHWRSWLARFHGMEEVKGSNPLCSTINNPFVGLFLVMAVGAAGNYQPVDWHGEKKSDR